MQRHAEMATRLACQLAEKVERLQTNRADSAIIDSMGRVAGVLPAWPVTSTSTRGPGARSIEKHPNWAELLANR